MNKIKVVYFKLKPVITKTEHIINIGISVYIIITSLYDIGLDFYAMKKEHGLLLIGIFTLIRSILEIRKKIKEIEVELKE